MNEQPSAKKPLVHHTFVPALIVILAISAFVAMVFMAMWPSDKDLGVTQTPVYSHNNTNTTTNSNTATTNTNTTTSNTNTK